MDSASPGWSLYDHPGEDTFMPLISEMMRSWWRGAAAALWPLSPTSASIEAVCADGPRPLAAQCGRRRRLDRP